MVFEAANEMVQAGEHPASLAIYEKYGRKGSLSTITKYLKMWRETPEAKEADSENLPAVIEIPETIANNGNQLIKQIWTAAKFQADEEVSRQKEALAQAEKAVKAEHEAIVSIIDEKTGEIEQKDEEIETLKNDLVNSNTQTVQLKDQLADLKRELQQQHKDHAREISTLKKDHGRELQDVTEAKKAAEDAHNTALSTIEALTEKMDELEKKVSVVKGQMDQAKKGHKAEIEQLNARHDKAVESLAQAHQSAISEMKAQTAASVKQYQDTIDDLKKQREKAEAQTQDAETRAREAADLTHSQTTEIAIQAARIKELEKSIEESKPKAKNPAKQKAAAVSPKGDKKS